MRHALLREISRDYNCTPRSRGASSRDAWTEAFSRTLASQQHNISRLLSALEVRFHSPNTVYACTYSLLFCIGLRCTLCK
jgi:hypothetical protein